MLERRTVFLVAGPSLVQRMRPHFCCAGTAARGQRSQTVTAAKRPNVVLSDSEQELLRQMGQLFDSKQQEFQNQFQDLKKQFADQKQLLGSLVEASARQQISKIFGEIYVETASGPLPPGSGAPTS